MGKKKTINQQNRKRRVNQLMRREAEREILNPEVLLTNSFILTEKMHRIYSKETFRLYHKKWSNKVLFLAIGLLFAGLICLLAFKWMIAGIAILAVGLYCLGMSRFGYLYGSWREYRNFQEYFGMLVEMEVEFTKRYFRIKTDKGAREFPYSQITRRIELTDISILIVGSEKFITHGQIIDKRTFTPKELETYYDILETAGIPIS